MKQYTHDMDDNDINDKRSQKPVKVCSVVTNTGSSPGIYAGGDSSSRDGQPSSV